MGPMEVAPAITAMAENRCIDIRNSPEEHVHSSSCRSGGSKTPSERSSGSGRLRALRPLHFGEHSRNSGGVLTARHRGRGSPPRREVEAAGSHADRTIIECHPSAHARVTCRRSRCRLARAAGTPERHGLPCPLALDLVDLCGCDIVDCGVCAVRLAADAHTKSLAEFTADSRPETTDDGRCVRAHAPLAGRTG